MFLVVSQPRGFVAQSDKEIQGFGMFARNLSGIRSEVAWSSEFAWNLLAIRSEIALGQRLSKSIIARIDFERQLLQSERFRQYLQYFWTFFAFRRFSFLASNWPLDGRNPGRQSGRQLLQ